MSGLALGPGHWLVHVFNTCPHRGGNKNPDGTVGMKESGGPLSRGGGRGSTRAPLPQGSPGLLAGLGLVLAIPLDLLFRRLFCVWQAPPTPETCLGPSHPPCQQPTSCRPCMPSRLSCRDWPWSSSGCTHTPTCMAATYQVRKIITGEVGRGFREGQAGWAPTYPPCRPLLQPEGPPPGCAHNAPPLSAGIRFFPGYMGPRP